MEKIYIPTVGRIDRQITYNALPPTLQDRVTFVVQAWERNQYPYKAEYLILPETITPDHARSISETRKIIYEAAQTTKYAMLDDDLIFLRRNAKYWTGISDMEKSSQPCSHQDILDMFQLFSRWLDEDDCTVCGCSQVQNIPSRTLYRKHTSLTSGLWINGPNFSHELPTMDVTATRVGEDVNFLLSLLSRGYGNRVSTQFSMRNCSLTSKDLDSKLWDLTDYDSVQRDHETLEQMFPGIFTILRHPDGSRVSGGFRNFGKSRIYWSRAYKHRSSTTPNSIKPNTPKTNAAARVQHPVETVSVASLKPHPKNYRKHLPAQLQHLCESISQHGLYRNIVIAKDSTILAGHGVIEAVKQLGLTEVQVIRLKVSPESEIALKVLTGDNEISNLADVDELALLNLLRDIDVGDELLGTGFDAQGLQALFQSSSPREFAEDAWAGMPEFTQDDQQPHRQIIVSFNSEENVAAFERLTKMKISPKTKSVWFPPEEDVSTISHVYSTPDADT
jgi:hypothetical protein